MLGVAPAAAPADRGPSLLNLDVSDSVRGHNPNAWVLSDDVMRCVAAHASVGGGTPSEAGGWSVPSESSRLADESWKTLAAEEPAESGEDDEHGDEVDE